METCNFFAIISRMKYIHRWGLMNNTRQENLCEHSIEVAIIAHALATIRNVRFGGSVNPERAALLGIYHDSSEIITGDLPTPIKYYNAEIKKAYKEIERNAQNSLVNMLPGDLKGEYSTIINPVDTDKELLVLVKAADKLSALIKCTEELRFGNKEFTNAEQSTKRSLEKMNIPEVNVFITEMLPSYSLTIDEQ